MILRVSQEPAREGGLLMKRDGEMLEQVQRDPSAGLLRFYEWDPPTVSLGFHQKESLLDRDRLRAARVPFVRRPTGGAAVLHSQELTYAIAIGAIFDAGAASRITRAIGSAIAAGLRDAGVNAVLDAKGESLEPLANRASCFARTSRFEVTVGGKKIVGSAQRRMGNAILQHGSILTGPDHVRIVEFLAVKSEDERDLLRRRLDDRTTSVEQEIGRRADLSVIRACMERRFVERFRSLELETTRVNDSSAEGFEREIIE